MAKLILSIALAARMLAQKPEFDVASIHIAKDDDGRSIHTDGGLFRTHSYPLKALISAAYDLDPKLISGGPPWADTEGYDISAKMPQETMPATPGTVRPMLQKLLADRFHLVMHRQPGEISGYELALAKNGPKMTPAPPGSGGASTNSHNHHLTATNVTMESFAKHLSGNRDVGKLVVDKTGLTGGFNFELDWSPDGLDDNPSIFTALRQRLGLKLNPAKIPIQTIVIDQAHKPDEN